MALSKGLDRVDRIFTSRQETKIDLFGWNLHQNLVAGNYCVYILVLLT